MSEFKGYIYLIENLINRKMYVGQTINLARRQRAHLHCYGGGTALQPAIEKYGKDAFLFSIIESCDSQDILNQRESYWVENLSTLSPDGYNLVVYQPVKMVSAETRNKMSAWQKNKTLSEEHKKKIGLAGKGRKFSEDHRKRIAVAHLQEKCNSGHLYSADNTQERQRKDGRIYRSCKICRNKNAREKYHQRKSSGEA